MEKWQKRTEEELKAAAIIRKTEGDGIYIYRDRLVLKPGDILLIEQNVDFCRDLNTSISRPISQFSHAGIFLEIETPLKKRLPAVLEVYSHGLRFVPVDLYLGRRFSHYTEVHRSVHFEASWAAKLRRFAKQIQKERGLWTYDFYAKEIRDAKEKTANCSSLPSHMFLHLGQKPLESRCEVEPGALELLKALGLNFKKYLTPTDYRRDADLKLVGVVDPLYLESVLAQELVIRNASLDHTLAGIFSTRKWNVSAMPSSYAWRKSLLEGVYSNQSWAWLALNNTTSHPWTKDNFPQAPPAVIAFIQTVGPVVEKAVLSLRREILDEEQWGLTKALTPSTARSKGAERILEELHRGEPFRLSKIENDPSVRGDVAERLIELEAWFPKK
ncbi:MAG: hypothetical protein R3B54_06280 [Bdellovibrionota bacterium]